MEILERTLDTRRDDVARRHRPGTDAAAPPRAAKRELPPRRRLLPRTPSTGYSKNRADAPAKKSCCPTPEEESSSDLQLREIYSRETQVNIAAVQRFVDAERARTAPHVVSEEAYRACHTLSGSSRMAEARHGIRLTAPLEHWVRKSFDSGVGLGGADLDLLADCMNAMQSVAAHLDESTGFFQSHGALLARIEQATEQLEQRIVAAARAAELAAAPDRGGLASQRRAGGRGAPRFLSARKSKGSPGSRDAAAPAAAAVVEDVLTDFDQEIASIFTDEAVELIDASQGALAQWNENRSSVDGLTALKRPLHTLKGGARMAGLIPMGDLAHELETLFMQIDSGAIAPDDRAFSLAQAALDELARMRESVSGGKGVPTARGLIAQDPGAGASRFGTRRASASRCTSSPAGCSGSRSAASRACPCS